VGPQSGKVSDMLEVIDVFDSIQGEGILIGTPMSFVRLSGCNLRCKWCDTPEAFKPGVKLTEEEIAGKCNYHWVCITGGEPMLQDLSKLVDLLHENGHEVAIETNGTVPIIEVRKQGEFEWPIIDRRWDIDFWTISPKLSNSGMKDRLKLEKLAELYNYAWQYDLQLKFVIQDIERDITEVLDFLKQLERYIHRPISCPIVLQPERVRIDSFWTYFETLRKMFEYATEILPEYDVRILPQLHKLIGVK